MTFTAAPAAADLPDLVLEPGALKPMIEVHTFLPTACEVQEGCATAGVRKLLRFGTYTKNLGPADLVLGNPEGNPLFHWHGCHGHYHLEDYVDHRLRDEDGTVAAGMKASFCLRDQIVWDPSANPTAVYNCQNQGLQRGWGDDYDRSLPCQWIDITDVPPGTYALELQINTAGVLRESDYSNNTVRIPILLRDDTRPPNDSCSSPQTITTGIHPVNTYAATSAGPSEDEECFDKSSAEIGDDVWYRFTSEHDGRVVISMCGSGFDAFLAVYRSNCPSGSGRAVACSDDACDLAPQVRFDAAADSRYLIRVGGINGDRGLGVLDIRYLLNDRCNDAHEVGDGVHFFHNMGASSGGPSSGRCNPGGWNRLGSDVWFEYRATRTGDVTVDLCGSDFDTMLEVYDRSCPDDDDGLLACGDNECGSQGQATFRMEAGQRCFIRVGGRNDAEGEGVLRISSGQAARWCQDADIDGFGNPNETVEAVEQPTGYVSNDLDCDDGDADVHAGADEACDGKDNNCDGRIDEGLTSTWYRDADRDGFGDSASSREACAQPAGHVARGGDCDDGQAGVHPGAQDIGGDGIDQDCDGQDADKPPDPEPEPGPEPEDDARDDPQPQPDAPTPDDSAPPAPQPPVDQNGNPAGPSDFGRPSSRDESSLERGEPVCGITLIGVVPLGLGICLLKRRSRTRKQP